MRRVLFLTRVVQGYRAAFHERVRAILAERDIEYLVGCGEAEDIHELKQDVITLPWSLKTPSWHISGLIWQPFLAEALRSDLVIIGQESKYLLNYPLQMLRTPARKVALFGHGRNFQSRRPDGVAERWKRFWATKCDWWFGYTDETRRHVESLGFPPDRITVFNNAVDTSALRDIALTLRDDEVAAALCALGAEGANMAIFVGGLYPDKRLDFLVKSADLVRERIPDFELVVVGGGVDMPHLLELAANRPWIFIAGPRFGREKAALMRGAKLFLMPGLVGLAVLDAAAMDLPVVTTAWPWHSPEIAYLQDGVNGAIVSDWESIKAYADAVIDLMLDGERRAELVTAAYASAQGYTINAMAKRFAVGVMNALG